MRLFFLATTVAAEGRRDVPALRSCRGPFMEDPRVGLELRRPLRWPATTTAFLALSPGAAVEPLALEEPLSESLEFLVTICLASLADLKACLALTDSFTDSLDSLCLESNF